MPLNNRRLNNRARKRLQVRYGEEDPCRLAFTEDIHRRGLFLKTAQPLRPGTRLRLVLNLPNYGNATLRGQVRWARKVPGNLIRVAKGGMGICFLGIEQGSDAFKAYFSALER